jgi:two-component system sensor kinase FixL
MVSIPRFLNWPEGFNSRTRILLLILVMSSVVLILGTTIIMTLFFSSADANKHIMTTFAENQANQIRSIVLLSHAAQQGEAPSQAVINYVRLTIDKTPPITNTAEVMVAYREAGNIHVISHFRFSKSKSLKNISVENDGDLYAMDDPHMAAMKLALTQTDSGLLITQDYRDRDVLAAYSGVEGTNIGVVTKIDVDEVRGPFVATGIAAGVASIVLIAIGTFLFHRIGNPLVQRLEENETKYRTLFESANEGVLVISDHIEECNDRACQLLGYSKAEIVGSTINEFSPPAQPEGAMSAELARKRFELARQGTPQYFLWQSLHKDGSVVDLDVMLRAVRVGDRRFILATLLDITDRQRAEMELRRAEKNVSEAREHLAHVARLSTMGEMAAGIAHEINQPLAAISTYAQACKRMLQLPTVSAQDFAEPLEKIGVQAMRAGEVIRRLRSFVKKSDSGVELLQCNQLVRDIVKLAEVDARKFDIPVELNLQERLPAIRVDPVQLQQVILNLIRNALEAMEDIPRELAKVTLTTELTTTGQVCIRVSDRGHGLTEETLGRVFHPFFTTKAAGMGMGLSISQSIIQAHGGTLGAYNNPSRGATFVVVLPSAVGRQVAGSGV